ncbi:MAG: RelA/SpoT family protein [Chloroflexota bacterium]
MTQVPLFTLPDLINALPTAALDETAVEQIAKAYAFAEAAHAGRRRASGETYIDHDMAVTQILSKLGVDSLTIVVSLLHDVLLPHTGYQEADIRKNFGETVSSMVMGLNTLHAFTQDNQHKVQGNGQGSGRMLESVRNAILFIIEKDARTMLIRLADCLADLRRASHLSTEEQRSVAAEALNIYAPLANRLGIWQLKWELEDLSFRYLQPEKYHKIAKGLSAKRVERTERIQTAANLLRERIAGLGIEAEVNGRSKHIYSIYRKMQQKELDIDQVYDIQALRVIIFPPENKELRKEQRQAINHGLCYQVLGAVHSLWQPIPNEFDDYIASPKPNGYMSLHTAVFDGISSQQLEVQIRTLQMHEEAEKGVAAHWAYKEPEAWISISAQRRFAELRDLLNDFLSDAETEEEDVQTLEEAVVPDRIYVFTPNRDLIDLPEGATPIDFAYQIHTEVGHRCRGAKVNGKMVSLDYTLKSGQTVDIITAKRGKPSRDWMSPSLGYTKNPRTRSKIRGWFREQEREENIAYGKDTVERELKRLALQDTFTIADIANALKYDDVDTFLAKVGFGDISYARISGSLALMKRDLNEEDEELRPLLELKLNPPPKPKGLSIKGVSGLHTRMAGCCDPIPPEPIVGYITRGQGVTIHRANCKQVEIIRNSEGERIIDEVDWGTDKETFPIPIVVRAYRRPALIDEMVSLVRGKGIGIPKTKTLIDGTLLNIYLVAEVANLSDLNWLMKKFENLQNVIEVSRQRWN